MGVGVIVPSFVMEENVIAEASIDKEMMYGV